MKHNMSRQGMAKKMFMVRPGAWGEKCAFVKTGILFSTAFFLQVALDYMATAKTPPVRNQLSQLCVYPQKKTLEEHGGLPPLERAH